MKYYLVLVAVGILMLVGGCMGTTSQYLLTSEYTNANTGQVERIDIPVSQYVYEQTGVGDNFQTTVHTAIFGMRVPITDHTKSAYLELLDTVPLVGFCIFASPLIAVIYQALKKGKFPGIVLFFAILMLAIGIFIISTTAPEFTTMGTIIDKTFVITSY